MRFRLNNQMRNSMLCNTVMAKHTENNLFNGLFTKRIQTILTLILLLCCVSNAALADDTTWDGTDYSTTGTKFAENKFADEGLTTGGHDGKSWEKAYVITTARQLAYFAWIVRNNKTGRGYDYYWKLGANIDLANHHWMFGSNAGGAFQGHFDGQDHTISNLKLDVTTNSNYALLTTIQGASTEKLAEVKNLKITNVTFTSEASRNNDTRWGALAGTAKQAKISNIDISNVTFTLQNKVEGNSRIGGAIGYLDTATSLDDVDVTGVTATFANTTTSLYFGGIVGQTSGTANTCSMVNCDAQTINVTHSSNITGTTYMGGLVGNANTSLASVTTNTVNGFNASVSGTATNFYAGGLLGYKTGVGHNISGNTVTGSSVNVAGTSTTLYVAGLIGQLTGDNLVVKNNSASNVTTTIATTTGATINGTRLGGFIGHVETNGTTGKVHVKGNTATTVSITVGGKTTGTPYLGGFIGYVKGKASPDNRTIVEGNSVSSPTITMNGEVANGFYMGGFIGQVVDHTNLYNNKVTTPVISITNDINAETYIGGAVGRQMNYTNIDGMSVSGGSITGNTTTDKFIKNSVNFFVGGIIGMQNSSGTTLYQPNKFKNVAISGMTINLGHFVPAGTITNHKFAVGGIAGSVNTPNQDADGNRGVPENLVAKGLKIYAPFAATSPTIANFNGATATYDTYSGENVKNVDAVERSKSGSWLYNDYKLGLSKSVLSGTNAYDAASANGKVKRNYKDTPTADATDSNLEWLTVNDGTFLKKNRYIDVERESKTVLWWTRSDNNATYANNDIEQTIYPQNNNNTIAKFAESDYKYYMYFYQGVANAKHTDATNAENIIKGIEANVAEAAKETPIKLTISNENEGQRGFGKQTFSVAVASGDGTGITYQWYVDGVDAGTTTSIQVAPHWKLGKNIHVNAIKDGKIIASASYAMTAGVFKTKNSEDKVGMPIANRGTESNPYIIDSEEALRQLSYLSTWQNSYLWEGLVKPAAPYPTSQSQGHYNRAYYEMDADITLTGGEFTPISHIGTSNSGSDGTYSQNYIFQGSFDGKGHSISGLNIKWGAAPYNSDVHAYYGLFGAVGNPTASQKWGDDSETSNTVIKNLIIKNATLTHDTGNTSFYYNNATSGKASTCHVGVLAGIVSSNTTIQNIEIRNSAITDAGSSNYSLATKGLHVGGAIGSVQNSFSSTGNVPANTIINHVVAQVDITLTHPDFVNSTASAQTNKFNVGGIIGRYYATSATYEQVQATMPEYTFFSGRINAPNAWISPVLSYLRYKDNNNDNFTHYSRQWEGNNNTVASQFKIKNAQFSDFYIGAQDMQNGVDVSKVSETNPDNKCGFGNRTILPHTDAKETAYSAGKYQGVNYEARYIDGVGAPLELLNQDIIEGYNWVWSDNFVHMTTTETYKGANIAREEDTNNFTASMSDGSTPSAYEWKASFDGTNWITIPDATNATYTAQENIKPMYIKASLTVNGTTYNTLSELVTSSFAVANPTIIVSKDDEGNNVFTVDWQGNDPTEKVNVTYQWYKKGYKNGDERDEVNTQISQNGQAVKTQTLTLTNDELVTAGRVVWCKVTLTDKVLKNIGETPYVIEYFELLGGKTVVYIDGKDGVDNNGVNDRGWTPTTAVKTINNANSLLLSAENGGTIDNNIIVIIGELNPDMDGDISHVAHMFQSNGTNPATLTGKWDTDTEKDHDYKAVINIKQYKAGKDNSEHNPNPIPADMNTAGHNCYVLGDTKFQYLTFKQIGTNGNNFIECHGNDVWFGKGIKMANFQNLSDNHGNLGNQQNIPELTIVLTATNLTADGIAKYTENRKKPQTLTIESGRYGRIMGGRFTQEFFAKAENTGHTILGTAANPMWAVVNINIVPDNPNNGATLAANKKDYTCDINCVIAGLTDGAMYGDYEINLHGGNVRYIVGGNQGNPVKNGGSATKVDGKIPRPSFTPLGGKNDNDNWGHWPNSSYFGRTIINVERVDTLADAVVGNLYAGGLGRKIQSNNETPEELSVVDMYVYGRTEVNVKSGIVEGNVYAGGAGGVIGLNPWDAHVPYATTAENAPDNAIYEGVQYGDNQFGGTWSSKQKGDALADVILHNSNGRGGYLTETLNLANSSTTVNITGGIIGTLTSPGGTLKEGTGNVYGGGAGEVSNMPEGVAMQGVGSVFGTSNVNISGGTIYGSVYGGSQGGMKYYGFKNTYGQTIDHIAEMNGTVNMNITGTAEQYPTIGGNIYGAGQGLTTQSIKKMNGAGSARDGALYDEEFLTIARAGNADLGEEYKTDINITIDLPDTYTFAGNIYGGGEMGKLDGTTNIVIKGGKFTGKVFGGSYGETGHDNKALVTGETNVELAGGVVTNDIYGGGQIAHVKGNTNVMTESGIAQANVYGGGYLGTVSDMANVHINGGDIYGSVFGGGDQAIVGTAKTNEQEVADWVQTNGTTVTMNSITANVYGDIFGGGNLANVEGNTNISLYAGNFGGNIFGGGNGKLNGDAVETSADVTGNTIIYISQDEGGQDEETKEDNFSINVIWNKKWNGTSFDTWKDNISSFFIYDGVDDKIGHFLNPHNIYGGGNIACKVGTYADAALIDVASKPAAGTGNTTVTVLKGMTPFELLTTNEWKNSYDDNNYPHFSVFGGGYGKNTLVGSTNVTVNVEGEYGEYTAEVGDDDDDDLIVLSPGKDGSAVRGPKSKASPEHFLPVFDNSKGIPNFTVLGALGGGYAGIVSGNTNVTIDGKTFLHRVYGGGFGDPNSTANNTTGQVGGNTEVFVNGANTYGDVFGGGAGVVSKTRDLDDVARVLGKTNVTVANNANIYGKVYGGGDMACVGVAIASGAYTKTSGNYATSVSSVSSLPIDPSAPRVWTYSHDNHQSFVNILGGNIYDEVYGGGKGVLKTKAYDYTKVGRIEGSTLVHIADGVNGETVPYVWNRIYGGCAYGVIDGNTMVHVEGGMLGLNIFGGGYGDMTIVDDQTDSSSGASTASSTLDQVLGKKDTEATFANILGNTKVVIDGGSWIWNRKADSNGNITTWEDAGRKVVDNIDGFKALVAQIQQATTTEDLMKIEAVKSIDQTFFNLSTRQFAKNHNIFGGGNRACFVGTYTDTDASSTVVPAANTGTSEVIINHSPITKIDDGNGKELNMLDNTTVAGLCWYLGINNISHPQFSVFGAGYGANTKVYNTFVDAQPGMTLNGAGSPIAVGDGGKAPYINQDADLAEYYNFEQQITESYEALTNDERRLNYGSPDGQPSVGTFLRYRASQMAWSAGTPNFTFMDIHGGGFSGYVVNNANVTTDCQLNARNVFGAGLGAKPYGAVADQAAANTFTFGKVGGDASVFVKSGIVSLNVYGGGAGIESYDPTGGTSKLDFPNIALVGGKTNVDVYGEAISYAAGSSAPAELVGKRFERTIIYGSVYGGGDVANVGKSGTDTEAAIITDDNKESQAYTTFVNIRGGSIQSQAYAGGNGRLADECSITGTPAVFGYKNLGAVYGNTRIVIAKADMTYPYSTEAQKKTENDIKPYIWNRIYGGCQSGTVYGNTLVDIRYGELGHNIFGGGFGDDGTGLGQSEGDTEDLNGSPRIGRSMANITSADVTGNTNIIINGGEMELTSFWHPDRRTWEPATVRMGYTYSPQYDPDTRKFKINHNIYGGGNAACTVGGNTYVTMNTGLIDTYTNIEPGNSTKVAFETNEWKEVYQKVGSPHFSIFGAGYGEQTVVAGNTNLNIQMNPVSGEIGEIKAGEEYKHFLGNMSVMDIVGGGYSGKVVGETNVNVKKEVFARRVFGGGFYNTVDISNVNITAIDCYDIFGGGLMGDILKKTNVNVGSNAYEADNSKIFIHGNIYGGNDVSGYINMNLNNEGYFQEAQDDGGTYINIYGGRIDGNVYGAGNGDYLYALDREGHEKVTVNEHYLLDPNDPKSQNFDLVYTVPMRETMPSYLSASDAAKIVNINSFRPLTNRVNIHIEGKSETEKVTIRGDVYGGGNSATVQSVYTNGGTTKTGDVNFNIGNYVNIGRVFMGCNGDKLFTASEDNAFLADFQKLNNLHLDDEINWATDPSNHGISTLYLPTENDERPIIYPHLLDLYFQPVEMDIQASLKWDGKTANETQSLTNCTIGTFCCGGNRGNMNVYPISSGGVSGKEGNVLDYLFPEGLTITDKIIGGCNNANYEWFNNEKNSKITHVGGYLLGEGHTPYPFIKLTIKNKFQPTEVDGAYKGGNVFGGCFYTGTVRGDISVDLKSDMLAGKNKAMLEKSNELLASNSEYAALNVYGAGYGMESFVYGNTNVLFGEGIKCTVPTTGDTFNATGTSANFVYGGGQQGNVIGVTNVDIRNGHIYKSVTGGSYSGYVYGSTQIKVGYPTTYTLNPGNAGRYLLNRTDENNLTVMNTDASRKSTPTIKQYINLIPGDVITEGVYNAIYAKYNGDGVAKTDLDDASKATIFTSETKTPSVGWDNINIYIDEACYGGGYSLAQGSSVMANNTTVLKYTENYNINNTYRSGNLADLTGGTSKGTTVGFGGNTMMLIGDATTQPDGATEDRDHISISHQEMKEATLADGSDLFGYYYKDKTNNYHYISKEGTYIYHTGHAITLPDDASTTDNKKVYKYDGEGGIFGDGHLSYAEGFRAADLTGYGFASTYINNPKIVNTFQRMDILRLTDNCFTLLGARDYATNATNKTPYSISRVGEIQMIANNIVLAEGKLAGMGETSKRSRNYMGLANNIHYVGAIMSNVPFNDAANHPWRDGTGAVGTGDNSGKSYETIKQEYIDNYYSDSHADKGNVYVFQKRNDGTAKNMIGIASGYALKIQNVQEDASSGKVVDNIYYGPIYGVVEMNLIDVRDDEGGGYVYADNVHKRSSVARDAHAVDFLETTGNFVFPYNPVEGRYIVDDCFPIGYDNLNDEGQADPDHAAGAEAHYWYVTGYNYYYNAHITGYTYDSSSQKIFFDSDNKDGLTLLSGLKAGQEITVKSWKMRSGHPNNEEHIDSEGNSTYSCDLEYRNYLAEGTDGNVDASGNDVSGHYTLYVGGGTNEEKVDDTEPYNTGFVASLPMNATTETTVAAQDGRANLPLTLTSDAKITFRLEDNVNNTTSAYYNNHLSEPCYATLVLSAPAMKYETQTIDGQEKDVLVPEIGYIGIADFYVKNSNGTFSPASATTIANTADAYSTYNDKEDDAKYYYVNNVTKEYTPILNLDNLYYRDSGKDGYIPMHDGSTYKEISINQNGVNTKYYYLDNRIYTYTIYLTIDYVQGPNIEGHINVENCALPGEMIRVNKKDVQIQADESFAPDGYFWRIGKRVKDAHNNWVFEDTTPWTKDVAGNNSAKGFDSYIQTDAAGTGKGYFYGCNYDKTNDYLDIPAYYYMDGYGIQLGVSMNGLDQIFPVNMDDDSKLVIHNYHRMKPRDTKEINLHLAEAVARAKEYQDAKAADSETTVPVFAEPRIYLSDNEDLAAFVNYLDTIGTASGDLPSNGIEYVKLGAKKENTSWIANLREVPRYGKNTQFVLQENLRVSPSYNGTSTFAGTLHGDGYVIEGLTPGNAFFATNNGHIHNLGMASGKIAENNGATDAEGNVTENNGATGQYHCCFEYAPIVSATSPESQPVVYRINGTSDNTYTYEDFRIGKVTYDLNEYYLEARRILAGAADNGTLATTIAASDANSKTAALQYVLDYFGNGDYQYAHRKNELVSKMTGITYLRTGSGTDEPNYGYAITRHNMEHTIDKPRAIFAGEPSDPCTANFSHYLPLFNAAEQTAGLDLTELMNDYIFWGHDLQITPDAYPAAIESKQISAMTNRVYRAVGYYGDNIPAPYHYNAYNKFDKTMGTYLHTPSTTAIDFTCQADGNVAADSYKTGLQTLGGGQVYYPPFNDVATNYSNFAINNSNITQNLLVYTPANDKEIADDAYDAVKSALSYNESARESVIRGHHIYKGDERFEADYLHLVERTSSSKNAEGEECISNDFCAPIPFYVKNRAWYTRVPSYYAESNNDAWEGICLPFTVNKAVASLNGEITHFYGTPDDSEKSLPATNFHTLHHEYWLRGMTDVKTGDAAAGAGYAGKTIATFQRPGSTKGLFVNASQTAATTNYSFSNDFFIKTYGAKKYNSTDNTWYAEENHNFADYLPLTSAVPYVVSFPGNRYYEFDLSSTFYNKMFNLVGYSSAKPAQTVTFNAYGRENSVPSSADVLIPVTSEMKTSVTKTGSEDIYNHMGTFSQLSQDASIYSMNSNGTRFETATRTLTTPQVLPFRTYITSSATVASPQSMHMSKAIYIGAFGNNAPEEISSEQGDPDKGITGPHLYIYPNGKRVVVDSTYPTTLYMYSIGGALIRVLDVRAGINTYSGFPTGIYIVGDRKITLR